MIPPGPWKSTTKPAVGQHSILVTGRLGVPPSEYHNHLYGYASGSSVVYDDMAAYVWFRAAPLDVPVRVHLSEAVSQFAADSEISFTYLAVSPVDVGLEHQLTPETKPDLPFRTFWVTGRNDEPGLITYRGGTAISRMMVTPAPEIVRVGPFTPKEVAQILLESWRDAGHDWLRWREIPDIGLMTSSGLHVPMIEALVVRQPDNPTEDPRTMLDVLREFLEPFPGFFMHVDPAGYLEIVNTRGVPALTDRFVLGAIGEGHDTYSIPFSGDYVKVGLRAVAYIRLKTFDTLNVIPVIGENTATAAVELRPGESQEIGMTFTQVIPSAANIYYSIEISFDGSQVTIHTTYYYDTWNKAGYDFALKIAANLFSLPQKVIDADNDLTPDEQITVVADEVFNIARVRSKGYGFNPQTDIMEPAAGLVNSHYPCWGNKVCVRGTRSTIEGSDGRFWLGDENSCVSSANGIYQLPNVWKLQPDKLLGDHLITIRWQLLEWGDTCGDLAGPGYMGDKTGEAYAFSDVNEWQTITQQSRGSNSYTVQVKPYEEGGRFAGFLVRVVFASPSVGMGVGIRLNGDGSVFSENENTIVAQFGEDTGDPVIDGSVATFGRRVKEIDMGPWPISYNDALRVAQAIVENYALPYKEYTVKVMPPYTALNAYDVGRLVRYKDSVCYVAGWRYDESHSPDRSRSTLSVRLREVMRVETKYTEETAYGEMVYTLGRYL